MDEGLVDGRKLTQMSSSM